MIDLSAVAEALRFAALVCGISYVLGQAIKGLTQAFGQSFERR